MTKKQFYSWVHDIFTNEALLDDIKNELSIFKSEKGEPKNDIIENNIEENKE